MTSRSSETAPSRDTDVLDLLNVVGGFTSRYQLDHLRDRGEGITTAQA
jgi:hypothetical protein